MSDDPRTQGVREVDRLFGDAFNALEALFATDRDTAFVQLHAVATAAENTRRKFSLKDQP